MVTYLSDMGYVYHSSGRPDNDYVDRIVINGSDGQWSVSAFTEKPGETYWGAVFQTEADAVLWVETGILPDYMKEEGK